MTHIYSIRQLPKESLTESLKMDSQITGKWLNRAVHLVNTLPIEKKEYLLIAIYSVANLIFFYGINHLAMYLEERVCSSQEPTLEDKWFNTFLIDGAIVGGTTLIFNIMISKLTNSPINQTTLLGIISGAMLVRLVSSRLFN